jgi:hypothetical protein
VAGNNPASCREKNTPAPSNSYTISFTFSIEFAHFLEVIAGPLRFLERFRCQDNEPVAVFEFYSSEINARKPNARPFAVGIEDIGAVRRGVR